MVATEYTWWEDSHCPRTFHSRRRENGHGTSDRFLPTPMWEMTDARDGSKRFRVSHRSKTRAKACRSSARRISQCFWTVIVYKRDSFGGLYRVRGAGQAGSLLVIPLLTSWNPPWFRAGAPVVCRFGVWPVSCVFAFVRVISRFGKSHAQFPVARRSTSHDSRSARSPKWHSLTTISQRIRATPNHLTSPVEIIEEQDGDSAPWTSEDCPSQTHAWACKPGLVIKVRELRTLTVRQVQVH